MKVLVVGGGGREHTIAWKLAESPHVDTVYAAPGNAGMAGVGKCVPVGADDKQGLLELAVEKNVDLTVVGPEAPLVSGITDLFRSEGQRIFGFDSKGALLEGSKVWAKQFMEKYEVPTGGFAVFDNHCAAQSAVEAGDPPFVIKADGLAAGKGVLICKTLEEAGAAVETVMKKKQFGTAGDRIIFEEFLEGPELSVIAIFDGKDYRLLVPSQDHKRAFDGDEGPNTGGMGAYAPVPDIDHDLEEKIRIEIIERTLSGIQSEGIEGAGVVYFGLMLTPGGPKVLEYNCRLGDPETQVILPLLKSDLFEVLFESTSKKLDTVDFENSADACACVVVASGGYPGSYEKGMEISGITEAEEEGCIVFHAGTKLDGGRTVTSGGRVLGVTAVASTLKGAVDKAYRGVDRISFKGCFSRRDIAWRALKKG
jgi:phosphoribosylamine--glycine ligase